LLLLKDGKIKLAQQELRASAYFDPNDPIDRLRDELGV
jgi:hypothetical protein